MDALIYKDKNGNYYLYSYSKKQLVYINKKLYILISEYLNGKTIEECISLLKQEYSNNIDREIGQFQFYIKHGFLSSSSPINIETKIDPQLINTNICNTYNIVLEVTQKCNLRCFYCTYGNMYNNTENNYNIDLDPQKAITLIKYIIENISKSKLNKSYEINIPIGFYGGEPLLNFNLIKNVVEYTKSLSTSILKFQYLMTTNGILLDKHIDYIIKNDFYIMISMDGDRKSSIYRMPLHMDSAYKKLISNINYIKDKFPSYYNKNVTFNSVLHDKNNILSITRYFKLKFNKLPKISELSDVSVSTKSKLEYKRLSKSLLEDLEDSKKDLSFDEYHFSNPGFNYSKRFFSKLTGINYKNIPALINEDKVTSYIPTSSCLPFSFKIFLSANGKLHLCEKIGYKHSIGNITNEMNIEINSSSLAKKYAAHYDQISKNCKNCYDFFTCSVCMFEKNFKCSPISKEDFKKKIEYYTNLTLEENYEKNICNI